MVRDAEARETMKRRTPWPVPKDSLGALFTPEVKARLMQAPPTEPLDERLRVLTATGPPPSDHVGAWRVHYLRAKKAAWDVYLDAAFGCGLFEGPAGLDLRARLIDSDDENFRAAMAECEAAWFLMGRLQLDVSPRPAGKDGRPLEFLVNLADGPIHVEVKAPFREAIADGQARSVDDSDILRRCLDDAAKQFDPESRNLLLLVGHLTLGLKNSRRFLKEAFYAEEKIVIPVSRKSGGPVGPARIEHDLTGRFLKQWGAGGVRHTRISGVAFVEERIREYEWIGSDRPVLAFHDALVMHNPHAKRSLPEGIWDDFPQLVARGDELLWTDGHPV